MSNYNKDVTTCTVLLNVNFATQNDNNVIEKHKDINIEIN